MAKARVAILISGRGSNMMALVGAARAADYPAEIALVLSNRPGAAGLARARAQGLAVEAIDHKGFPRREDFEDHLHRRLIENKIDLIACAGFMRLMTASFVERWSGRILNIHPSLLPAFKGLDTHARTLAAGARIAGCTVHFVVPEVDSGPIVAQAAVPVQDSDTPEQLAARILGAEHKLYPYALALVASGAARLAKGRVLLDVSVNLNDVLFSPAPPGKV
jgi:phosphoribosylglycinamide formyltransferase-1